MKLKIKLVAIILVKGRDIIDHVLEMIISLPDSEDRIEYAPNCDDYDPNSYRQSISLASSKNTYFIAKFDSLLRGNIEAYIVRKPYFKEFPYKVMNHVVRIVYLLEWLSQHSDSKVWKTLGSLYFMNRKPVAKDDFLFLKNQTLPLAELLNAYQNLYVDAEKKQWYQPSNGRTYTHKNLFIEPFPDSETMKKRHEDFLEKYFPVRSSRTKSLKKSVHSLKKGSLKKGTRSVKKKAKSATVGHQSKTRHRRREILTQ